MIYTMYKKGLSAEFIADVSNLSVDEVKSIIKSFGS